MGTRIAYGMIAWTGWAGLWMFFAGRITPAVCVTAAVVATIDTAVCVALWKMGPARFHVHRLRPRALLRIPSTALRDCAIVFSVLLRRLVGGAKRTGGYRYFPFITGRAADHVAAARRALVIAGISLSPNTYVVESQPRRHRLLVHQLRVRGDPPGDREWPL